MPTNPNVQLGFDETGAFISVDGTKFRKATKAGQDIVNRYGYTPAEAMKLVIGNTFNSTGTDERTK